MNSPYTTQSWEPVVIPLAAAAHLPVPFILKWIDVESGGNPCAFGTPGAKGPDGNPREIGLAQVYNPDDTDRLGIDAGKLRAYCVPGTQSCSRMLTADELLYAAKSVIKLADYCRTVASSKLAAVGARWPTPDTYKATKLVHALPGLLSSGLPAVTKQLGRAPESWAEFRDTIPDVKLDSGTEHYRWSGGRDQGPFGRLLRNAEETGNAVPDDFVA